MNRRDLIKGAAIAAVAPSILVGCKPKPGQPPVIDQVIDGLKVADQTVKALIPILEPVNPAWSTILGKVSTDMELVIKVYTDYDTAAGQTPSNADLIRATVGSIQGNLSALLDAVGVKNKQLLLIVTTSVAIANTALTVVLGHLPQTTVAHALKVGGELPTLSKSGAEDLRQAWNNAVADKYPQAMLK